jgi:D-alanine-D-alanine ligase
VEKYIAGREFNIALLQSGSDLRTLPVAEIDFSAFGSQKPAIVDYDAKWKKDSFSYNNTPRIIPADLMEQAAQKIRQYAVQAWNILGCSDYARADFRMDEKQNVFLIDLNPNPDISPDAGFAAALDAAHITYRNFIKTVIDNAEKRLSKQIKKDTGTLTL